MGINRYIRLEMEDTFAEGFKGTADVYFDRTSATLDVPDSATITTQGGLTRGKMYIDEGVYIPSGDVVLPLDLATVQYFLELALGEKTLNTYKRADVLNLKTCALEIAKDKFSHVFKGCCINSLSIDCQKEFITLTASFLSAGEETTTVSDFSTFASKLNLEKPAAFHNVEIKIDDVPVKCSSFSLKLDNGITEDNGVYLGSKYAQAFYTGEAVVSGSLEVELDENNLTKYRKLQTSNVKITIKKNGKTLEFELNKCLFDKVKQQVSGIDRVVQQIEFTSMVEASAEGIKSDLVAKLT